jgi:hypothetical protein
MLVSLLAVSAFGQGLQTGNIFGHTQAKDGSALPGVTVTLTGVGAPQTFNTDGSGSFRFLSLSPGTYALKAELAGFGVSTRQGISVNIGRNADVTMTLNPAASESITVTAEAPLLDVRKAGTGATVTKIELEKVPTGRDPWVILQQTPGVLIDRLNVGGSESGQQSAYTAKGVTGDQATWNVDGVNITDVGALGSSPTYYDFDSFEEMQVTTGGTDVRIQTAGVQLNMVTKRGTNDLKGSARYFRTDGSWQAKPKIPFGAAGTLRTDRVYFPACAPANPAGADVNCQIIGGYLGRSNRINNINDEGLEAGGPLMKDRVWLWGAYSKQDIKLFVPERTDQLCPPGLTGCVDTGAGRTQARLSPQPIHDNTTLKTANAKFNAQVASNNSLALSGNRGDKVKFGRNVGPTRPPETAWDQKGPTTITKIEDTHIFNPNFYLTGLYSRTHGGFQLIPDAGSKCQSVACAEAGPSTWFDINAVPHRSYVAFKTGRNQSQERADMSSFFNTGTWSHELKYGFGYRHAPVSSFTEWPGGSYTFMFDTALAPGGSGGAYLFRPANFSYGLKSTDAYIGDTLMMGNLTVQVGARYDVQKGTVDSGSTTANPTIPDILPAVSLNGKDVGSLKWTTVSPRLGLTYSLGTTKKTLLRAAANRYVDQVGGFTIYGPTQGSNGYGYLYYYFVDLNGNGRAERNELCLKPDGSDAGGACKADFGGGGLQGFSGLNPANTTTAQQVVRYGHMTPPRTNEFIVGFEHELMTDFSVGVNGTYRKLSDFIGTRVEKTRGAGDYVTSADYHLLRTVSGSDPTTGLSWSNIPVYALGFQPVWSVITNIPHYTQTYKGLELTATKRMSNRWMLRGNVSLNDWKQHVGADTYPDPTRVRNGFGCSICNNSEVVQGSGTGSGAKGGVYINSKWQYNVTGVYQIPVIETSLGFNITGRQGYPELYVHRVFVASEAAFKQVLVSDNAAKVRNKNLHNLDLRLAKDLRFFHSAGLTISLDAFNVTNRNTVLQRNTRLYRSGTAINRQAANITEIQSPRVLRLGARFTF